MSALVCCWGVRRAFDTSWKPRYRPEEINTTSSRFLALRCPACPCPGPCPVCAAWCSRRQGPRSSACSCGCRVDEPQPTKTRESVPIFFSSTHLKKMQNIYYHPRPDPVIMQYPSAPSSRRWRAATMHSLANRAHAVASVVACTANDVACASLVVLADHGNCFRRRADSAYELLNIFR